MTTLPRIYVACLASYNNGLLHGKWIDANQSAEEIQNEVNALLAASPVPGAEEWAIHDYEGFGVRLSEGESFETVAAYAEFITEHGTLAMALLSHFCGDLTEAQQTLENCYAGCHRQLADFAQELTEDTVTIPEALQYYIDYEAMARDMELNGTVFTIETGFEEVHVFWQG